MHLGKEDIEDLDSKLKIIVKEIEPRVSDWQRI